MESALTVGCVVCGVTLGGEQVNQHSGKLTIVLHKEESAGAVS
jgi:hypothetical protein